MEELDWLAALASDCFAFGEEHGLKHIKFGAQAIVDALERDSGLKFELLARPERHSTQNVGVLVAVNSNILLFPIGGTQLKAPT